MANRSLQKMAKLFPYFVKGPIVAGFGRGSKELGIPTANFPESVVDTLPSTYDHGVYYGWAQVSGGDIHKMVMSIGWNPHYQNIKKSMETHIMHKFPGDLYGEELKVCLLGYIRDEKSFSSLDALIEAINGDISFAKTSLEQPEHQSFLSHDFFKASSTS